MSSGSSIDKGSDERDQRDNDDKIERNISENDEEALIGDIESVKRDNIDRVDNKKSDEIFQIEKRNKMKLIYKNQKLMKEIR